MTEMRVLFYLRVPFSDALMDKHGSRKAQWGAAMGAVPEDMTRRMDQSHMYFGASEREGDAGITSAKSRMVSIMKGWTPDDKTSYQINDAAFVYSMWFSK